MPVTQVNEKLLYGNIYFLPQRRLSEPIEEYVKRCAMLFNVGPEREPNAASNTTTQA